MTVIALHGAKGSGKDQFYKAARAAFPQLDVRKIAYADPIRKEVCRIFGLASESEYDEFKRTDLTFNLRMGHGWNQASGRQVVREIGMLMRRYDEQQFTRYVETEIAKAPDALWCITDLRFDNELQSVRKIGAIVVKINRGGFEYDGHITETEFPDSVCDRIVHNVHLTLEQYNALVVEELNIIMGKENQ